MEYTIDVHGLTVEEAKFEIMQTVKSVNKNIWRIVVIHGYNRGTAIRDMIKREIKHSRVVKINKDLNPGVTIIELKH